MIKFYNSEIKYRLHNGNERFNDYIPEGEVLIVKLPYVRNYVSWNLRYQYV